MCSLPQHRLARCLLFLILSLLVLHLLYTLLLLSSSSNYYSDPSVVPITAFPRPELRVSNGSRFTSSFPKLIHVMWKKEKMPPETVAWQAGCKALNHDMTVASYNDEDLLAFTSTHYPDYLQLFLRLKGVHMADMARVLITYHFGGLYMDLDFYCVRPFKCLLQMLPKEVSPADNILIVSLETRMHSLIFKGKERVVIQDFFYATPKHPFFKYLLDDRMAHFVKDTAFNKGPFGYHIEDDIDNFIKLEEEERNKSTSGKKKNVIFELRDDVLHALGDATHSKLYKKCSASSSGEEALPLISQPACGHVQRGEFFQPTRNTIAVHMWFHTYTLCY